MTRVWEGGEGLHCAALPERSSPSEGDFDEMMAAVTGDAGDDDSDDDDEVGRCGLTVSQPVLKVPMVPVLETVI